MRAARAMAARRQFGRIGGGRASRNRARLYLGLGSLRIQRLGGPRNAPDPEEAPLPAGDGAAPAAEALRAAAAAHPDCSFEVRLACGWSRLLVLPWVPQLTREERWANLARARFEEVFGDDADNWDIRVARDLPGRERLAIAWPAVLQTELAASRQVRSVRVDLLEQLNLLLAREPRFTGFVAEIDGDSAGFALLADGRVRRVRWSRFDEIDGLVTTLRAEWAAIVGADAQVRTATTALALTSPPAVPGSPRARVASAIASGLHFARAFSLP